MNTPPQQPSKESSRRGEQIKQSVKESTWVTTCWNWITTFISRAAEPILLVCFLISLYSVLPDAPALHPGVMNTVFLVQSMTLDIAGIGLIMMCFRLKLGWESPPMRLGAGLLSIMIVSLIFAIIKGHTPDNPTYGYIEGGLLVVRAILAVLYAPVMHYVNHQLRQIEDEKTIDEQIQERLSKAVEAEMQALTDRFQSINGQLQSSLQSLSLLPGLQGKLAEIEGKLAEAQTFTAQEFERRFSFTEQEHERNVNELKAFIERESERKVNAVTEEMEHHLSEREREMERKMNAFKAFIERQKVTVQEIPPPPSLAGKQPLQLPTRQAASQSLPTMEREQFVHACLAEDITMTTVEIQRRGAERSLSLSAGTISKYRNTFTADKNERLAGNE